VGLHLPGHAIVDGAGVREFFLWVKLGQILDNGASLYFQFAS
jgi:hypothetical protein